jgi:hypothetical protein
MNISKKELILGFIIFDLILAIIMVITWRTTDNTNLVNEISLGSSLLSITLAVLAMVYAFFQTKSSSEQNMMVHNNLQKISGKLNELNEVKVVLSSYRDEVVASKIDAYTINMQLINSIENIRNQNSLLLQKQGNLVEYTSTNNSENDILTGVINKLSEELFLAMEQISQASSGLTIFFGDKIISRFAVFITLLISMDNEQLNEIIKNSIGQRLKSYDNIDMPSVTIQDIEGRDGEKMIAIQFNHKNVIFHSTLRDILSVHNGSLFTMNLVRRF